MHNESRDANTVDPARCNFLKVAVAGLLARGAAPYCPHLSRFETHKRVLSVVAAAFFFLLLLTKPGHTVNLDVPYVVTPHPVVAAMLDMADVGPGDYLIDLGSGDGRIVIAAAKRGAFGHGMDLDPDRVYEANANAVAAGVSDKVLFFQGDLFEADMSRATVVTMFLLGTVNLKLKPVLFEQLRPGTRVVSNTFSMGRWEADAQIRVESRNIYYWVIPADLRGEWKWRVGEENFVMDVKQQFQTITVELYVENRWLQVHNPTVVGERIYFVVVGPGQGKRYAFSGRVEGDAISGTFQLKGGENHTISNWDARRTER